MKIVNLTLNKGKNIRYVFLLASGYAIEKWTSNYLRMETYTWQNFTDQLAILCFQSFIKLFSLFQIKEEITVSKENAKKFCELIGSNPTILKECEKYGKDQSDIYEIYSKLAKAKGFDCTASELKDAAKPYENMNDDDLAAVSGGGKTEQAILSGLCALSAFGAAILKSKDKDGNINWKDPSLYMGGSMAALGAGMTYWMKYGNNGGNATASGNANANGNNTQK